MMKPRNIEPTNTQNLKMKMENLIYFIVFIYNMIKYPAGETFIFTTLDFGDHHV